MYYDVKIFEAINGLANQSKVVDALGVFLANYLPYLLVAFLLSFLVWPKKDKTKNRPMVFLSIIAACVARFVVKNIMLIFYNRPRPFVNLSSAHKLIYVDPSENLQSFPSGHVIFFFALSTVIYSYNKKLGIFFFVCSAIVGISRIFVGVHWPSDILTGIILGVAVGVAVKWLYVKVTSRKVQ
ncbi:MAG: phosphatase PAP2 family protein [Candidatus Staskawiczbacteria bacterium]|nr:phosphatase PAP2 family protein [Candidatus Staskawiczbacteria bacterium]